jgi:hypothetical protein
MKNLLKKVGFAAVLFMSTTSVAFAAGNTITNPLKWDSVTGLLSGIGVFLIELSIPLVTIMILWGAWQLLMSAGDPAKVKAGKQTIIYAILGFVVVLLASSIPMVIDSIISAE